MTGLLVDPATIPLVESELAQDLRVARDLIANGWCQGDYIHEGKFCILGAVYTATGFWSESESFDRANRAIDAIHHVIGGTVINPAEWNDRDGRTQDEVLAAFDQAILLA